MSTTGTGAQTWLTQDAHDRLSAELAKLIEDRPAIAAEINARREEGDLKENGGYHAAREEQGKQEGRIRLLEVLLRNAKVGAAPTAPGTAGPGSVVTVAYDGDEDDTETFLVGSREEAGTTKIAVYSSASPLGEALNGAHEGDTVSYSTPAGKTMTVKLLTAEPFTG